MADEMRRGAGERDASPQGWWRGATGAQRIVRLL